MQRLKCYFCSFGLRCLLVHPQLRVGCLRHALALARNNRRIHQNRDQSGLPAGEQIDDNLQWVARRNHNPITAGASLFQQPRSAFRRSRQQRVAVQFLPPAMIAQPATHAQQGFNVLIPRQRQPVLRFRKPMATLCGAFRTGQTPAAWVHTG